MKIPKNIPKGYSWIDFTMHNKNRTVEELLEYDRRSVLSTLPVDIVSKLAEYKNLHPELMLTPAGICAQYIIDHADLHYMLKEVKDGSYRTNRLLLLHHNTYFDNYEYQRFLASLCDGGSVYYAHEPETEEETLALFKECVEKDGVIFIHFDFTL